ncbi:MAG: cell envelope integrity protein TolA [Methylotenera sp.]|uniref:cell envelope integrity protein TolA n=1 Tax=Methylotenera sp. TaxID=2051956 RepID=UPI002724428A|nr:cell envelope integrity protein TolA [Methylotenera sp.]MDO9205780.1 cell envelope integrity protein TolA [Methylotenera sp.]MDO9394299.1 cell envelope integrity protein TolA [Methylotenera sp.]MDP1524125.1 cell envelope integrity protein TolA [Methylotenera sp.]
MIRAYEKEVSWKAGGLAIAVHLALLGGLLISFNWKAAHPILNVTEVELWDSIPNNVAPPPPPVVKPEVKIEPLPKPIIKEPEPPEPVVKEEPKVDIALQKKKVLEEKQKELEQKQKVLEQKKIEEKATKLAEDKRIKEERAKVAKMMLEEDLSSKEKQKSSQNEAAKKLAKDFLAEDNAAGNQQALSAKAAANAGVVDEYKNEIRSKIQGNVNKTLCGEGKPEPIFEIGVLLTGELAGDPKLTKSSGNATCDEAVERAILASQPLPLPEDAALKAQFRNLKLKFRPND